MSRSFLFPQLALFSTENQADDNTMDRWSIAQAVATRIRGDESGLAYLEARAEETSFAKQSQEVPLFTMAFS